MTAWTYVSFPISGLIAALHRRLLARRTRIVVVVGSLGKTSTHGAIAEVLGLPQDGRNNDNAWSDVAWRMLRVRPTDFRAVFEVGIAKPRQMCHYARMLCPQIVVVTSIASDHNRSLPSLEVTRNEKADMVRVLKPDGVAVLNEDDPNVVWMKGETVARILTYGFAENSDFRAENYVCDWPHGSRFTACRSGKKWEVKSRLIGRHMVYPLLAALAVAEVEGVDMDSAVAALEAVEPVSGRLSPVRLENGAWLLCDDYKSSLESYSAALDALESVPAQRRLVVLGKITEPAGNQHKVYRELGMRVGRMAARAFFIGGGRMKDMAGGAARAGLSPEAITWLSDSWVQEVAAKLRAELREGDVVLIKGRSIERLQRITLSLQGRLVRCYIPLCQAGELACENCEMRERGWAGLRVVT